LNQTAAERRVNPYAVHLHNGTLYLIGYCHMRKDIRSFVVDRMQKIKLAEESFNMPPGFSLEGYLRHSCDGRAQRLMLRLATPSCLRSTLLAKRDGKLLLSIAAIASNTKALWTLSQSGETTDLPMSLRSCWFRSRVELQK